MPRRYVTRPTAHAFPMTGRGHSYLVDDIPADLWRAARARARLDRVSMRVAICALLQAYADGLAVPFPAAPPSPDRPVDSPEDTPASDPSATP